MTDEMTQDGVTATPMAEETTTPVEEEAATPAEGTPATA